MQLPPPPKGKKELFTTPREKEAAFVMSVLRKNKIRYLKREEHRAYSLRQCIYVDGRSLNRAAKIVEEALDEEDNRQSPEGHGAKWD